MSAFIVSTECMDRVVNAIMADYWQPHRPARGFGDLPLHHPGAECLLAETLYRMNQKAVRQRYGDTAGEGGYDAIPAYVHYPVPVPPIVAHKAIRCLLYQCHEGDVPESALYKELDAFAGILAERIISDLPEWEAAPWG